MKQIADGITAYAVFSCIGTPLLAIFHGDTSGSGAFLAGSIIVSSIMFGEFYFRELDS